MTWRCCTPASPSAVAELPDELVLGPVQARLTRFFAGREADARTALIAALDSERYLALLAAIDRLLADPPLTRRARGEARRELPALVGRAHRRVAEHVRGGRGAGRRGRARRAVARGPQGLQAAAVRRRGRRAGAGQAGGPAGQAGQAGAGTARRPPGRRRRPPRSARDRHRGAPRRRERVHLRPAAPAADRQRPPVARATSPRPGGTCGAACATSARNPRLPNAGTGGQAAAGTPIGPAATSGTGTGSGPGSGRTG